MLVPKNCVALKVYAREKQPWSLEILKGENHHENDLSKQLLLESNKQPPATPKYVNRELILSPLNQSESMPSVIWRAIVKLRSSELK